MSTRAYKIHFIESEDDATFNVTREHRMVELIAPDWDFNDSILEVKLADVLEAEETWLAIPVENRAEDWKDGLDFFARVKKDFAEGEESHDYLLV